MPAGKPFTGLNMTLKTGSPATAVDHCGAWEVNIDGLSAEYATNSTGGWSKTVLGRSSWSGKMTILLHDGGGQPFARGDEVAAQFHIDSDDYISGTIIVTKVSNIKGDADSAEPVAIEYEFAGQGAPSKSGNAFDVIA